MTGLIIATHGSLAEALLQACTSIIGPPATARSLAIDREDAVEEVRSRLAAAIDDVGRDGDGVLIMTDMFGGTPANLSLAFLNPGRVEVLSGVNLPMVLKFFNLPEGLSLGERAALLKAYGQQGITLASDFLKQ
jgi:mannose PTS system EIIA component